MSRQANLCLLALVKKLKKRIIMVIIARTKAIFRGYSMGRVFWLQRSSMYLLLKSCWKQVMVSNIPTKYTCNLEVIQEPERAKVENTVKKVRKFMDRVKNWIQPNWFYTSWENFSTWDQDRWFCTYQCRFPWANSNTMAQIKNYTARTMAKNSWILENTLSEDSEEIWSFFSELKNIL